MAVIFLPIVKYQPVDKVTGNTQTDGQDNSILPAIYSEDDRCPEGYGKY